MHSEQPTERRHLRLCRRRPDRAARFSRRQAIGRMSAVAGAGAAAWVVPEILTAKPAAGRHALVGHGGQRRHGAAVGGEHERGTTGNRGNRRTGGVGHRHGQRQPGATGVGTTAAATTPGKRLAFTGLDIQRDAEIGAALVAGGWAMQHWASRLPQARPAGRPDRGARGGERGRLCLSDGAADAVGAPHPEPEGAVVPLRGASDDERLGRPCVDARAWPGCATPGPTRAPRSSTGTR